VQFHHTAVTNSGVAVSLEDRLEVLIWRFAAEAATRGGPNLIEVETDLFLREIRFDPFARRAGIETLCAMLCRGYRIVHRYPDEVPVVIAVEQ